MNIDPNPHLSCVWGDPHDWDSLSASTVPNEPGFYAFTDHPNAMQATSGPGQRVLYVGIATDSLRKRIRKYKTGDRSGISDMHRGGFEMFMSRAVAHYGDGELTHSVQRTPVPYTRISAGKPPVHGVLEPTRIYLRWVVDYRAAIERLLIKQLRPKYNTMHSED